MKQNIILDLCGGTGSWSKPFADAGFKVINIDIKEGWDVRFYNEDGNVLTFYNKNKVDNEVIYFKDIYGILAAPPCPMFSFARTNAKEPRDFYEALSIVNACLKIVWACQQKITNQAQKKAPLKFWVLENPNGMLKWFLGKPAFEFSPFEFGDDYKKKTHLWGCFNEPKKRDRFENLKQVVGARGINSLVKFDRMLSKDIHPEYYGKLTRQERRAITPKGFAKAFMEAQINSLKL